MGRTSLLSSRTITLGNAKALKGNFVEERHVAERQKSVGTDGESHSSTGPSDSGHPEHPSVRRTQETWVEKTKTLHEAGILRSENEVPAYTGSKESCTREEDLLAMSEDLKEFIGKARDEPRHSFE